MNDLIVFCAGAAADNAPDARGGMEPPRIAHLDARLRRGAVLADTNLTGNPLAELPEDAWLRDFFKVPPADAIQALAGSALDVPMPFWRLTPCHLHLSLDHAVLTDPLQLELTGAESAQLAATVAPSFAAAGLSLTAASPAAWFAGGPAWSLQAYPWTLASGRNISAYQPSGERARDWRRLLTEVQMLWHAHPVNEARSQAGQRPINALWLDGCATEPVPASSGSLITDDPALAGLGRAAGWRVSRFSAVAAGTSATPLAELSAAPSGSVIIDAGWWRAPRRLGDVAAWQDAWVQFERWLVEQGPVLDQTARTHRLRVVLTGERRVLDLTATPQSRWRFWDRLDASAVIGR